MNLEDTTTQTAYATIATRFDARNRDQGDPVSRQLRNYCMQQAGELGDVIDECRRI